MATKKRSNPNQGRIYFAKGIAPCLNKMEGGGREPYIAIRTICDMSNAVWYEKYQCYIAIRKLTPRECFRLQGWSDEYFDRAELVNSNRQLYKQAGNGVTVPVIYEIAKRMRVEK